MKGPWEITKVGWKAILCVTTLGYKGYYIWQMLIMYNSRGPKQGWLSTE